MSPQFEWTATLVWSIAVLLEGMATLGIIMMIALRRGFDFGAREWIDILLPPLVAAIVLVALLLGRRSSRPFARRMILLGCSLTIALALGSVVIWTIQVLPRVYQGGKRFEDAVIWEAELILVRMLPTAWPLVLLFARRRRPSAAGAGALLAIGSLMTFCCTGIATAALVHSRGFTRAFSPRLWPYTVVAPCTILLAVLVSVGLVLWLWRPMARAHRLALLVLGVLALAGCGMLHAGNDERMTLPQPWPGVVEFARNGALVEVSAELLAACLLWQVAPMALLVFAARNRREIE